MKDNLKDYIEQLSEQIVPSEDDAYQQKFVIKGIKHALLLILQNGLPFGDSIERLTTENISLRAQVADLETSDIYKDNQIEQLKRELGNREAYIKNSQQAIQKCKKEQLEIHQAIYDNNAYVVPEWADNVRDLETLKGKHRRVVDENDNLLKKIQFLETNQAYITKTLESKITLEEVQELDRKVRSMKGSRAVDDLYNTLHLSETWNTTSQAELVAMHGGLVDLMHGSTTKPASSVTLDDLRKLAREIYDHARSWQPVWQIMDKYLPANTGSPHWNDLEIKDYEPLYADLLKLKMAGPVSLRMILAIARDITHLGKGTRRTFLFGKWLKERGYDGSHNIPEDDYRKVYDELKDLLCDIDLKKQ
jgi:hypothetical protein